jgi:hypothetical protein
MKKVILFSAMVAFVTIAFSSCSPCEVCTKASEPEVRICEKDYGSATEYGITIDVMEASGFDCKQSL